MENEPEVCFVCKHPEKDHDCCPIRCAGCGDNFVYHTFRTAPSWGERGPQTQEEYDQ